MPIVLALIGDPSRAVTAHQAIPLAFERLRTELPADFSWEWIATRKIHDAARELNRFAGLWVVPGGPYENMAGALAAIRFARESGRPFLGTCGGFQHALIEFARNVAGLPLADHAETNPAGPSLVVTPLSCALVEATGPLRLVPGSLIQQAYGRNEVSEGYRCRYGPDRAYRERFEQAGLRFTATDEEGAIRAGELPTDVHPFFVGTLFQPERAVMRGETPPLVRAFVRAALGEPSVT